MAYMVKAFGRDGKRLRQAIGKDPILRDQVI
jgi:hypothetical protein